MSSELRGIVSPPIIQPSLHASEWSQKENPTTVEITSGKVKHLTDFFERTDPRPKPSSSRTFYLDPKGNPLPPPKPENCSRVVHPKVEIFQIFGHEICVYFHRYPHVLPEQVRYKMEIATGPEQLKGWESKIYWGTCKHKALESCLSELKTHIKNRIKLPLPFGFSNLNNEFSKIVEQIEPPQVIKKPALKDRRPLDTKSEKASFKAQLTKDVAQSVLDNFVDPFEKLLDNPDIGLIHLTTGTKNEEIRKDLEDKFLNKCTKKVAETAGGKVAEKAAGIAAKTVGEKVGGVLFDLLSAEELSRNDTPDIVEVPERMTKKIMTNIDKQLEAERKAVFLSETIEQWKKTPPSQGKVKEKIAQWEKQGSKASTAEEPTEIPTYADFIKTPRQESPSSKKADSPKATIDSLRKEQERLTLRKGTNVSVEELKEKWLKPSKESKSSEKINPAKTTVEQLRKEQERLKQRKGFSDSAEQLRSRLLQKMEEDQQKLDEKNYKSKSEQDWDKIEKAWDALKQKGETKRSINLKAALDIPLKNAQQNLKSFAKKTEGTRQYGFEQIELGKQQQQRADKIRSKIANHEKVTAKSHGKERVLTSKEALNRAQKIENMARFNIESGNVKVGIGSLQKGGAKTLKKGIKSLSKSLNNMGTIGADCFGATLADQLLDPSTYQKNPLLVATEVTGKTLSSVATQVGSTAVHEMAKATVAQIANESVADFVPGVGVCNAMYQATKAGFKGEDAEDSALRVTGSIAQSAVTMASAAIIQVLIPLPFFGAFMGATYGKVAWQSIKAWCATEMDPKTYRSFFDVKDGDVEQEMQYTKVISCTITH